MSLNPANGVNRDPDDQHFTLLTDAELPSPIVDRLASLPQADVFRMLAGVPECFHPMMDLAEGIYATKFNPRLREIAICRQASQAGSAYELDKHCPMAKKSGVTEDELAIILKKDEVKTLAPLDNLVCQAADELENDATLSEATRSTLIREFGQKSALELVYAISYYCCVARMLNASALQIEDVNALDSSATPFG
jgi:alkylhydroperoxidase family enzyme